MLLSVGKLLETRKTPFQREATKAISAFSIYPLPDGALTWFLYRIIAAKVTRQLIFRDAEKKVRSQRLTCWLA